MNDRKLFWSVGVAMVWVALATGCGDQRTAVTPISTLIRAPAESPTVSKMDQLPTPTIDLIRCPSIVAEVIYFLPTPSPSQGVPFVSDPDANGVRYQGSAAFSMSTTGAIPTDVLIITNTGTVPLPVSLSEFTITPYKGTPILDITAAYDYPTGKRQDSVIVAPGSTGRIALSVHGDDSRDLIATWTIRGHLGQVRLPLLRPQPLPTPTESRAGCR